MMDGDDGGGDGDDGGGDGDDGGGDDIGDGDAEDSNDHNGDLKMISL